MSKKFSMCQVFEVTTRTLWKIFTTNFHYFMKESAIRDHSATGNHTVNISRVGANLTSNYFSYNSLQKIFCTKH